MYFNNDREGHAIENALMLRRILPGMTDTVRRRAGTGSTIDVQ